MSDISVPITVKTLSIKMKLAAKYMSCPISDLKRIGPVVGRLITTETMVAPDISPGSIQPNVAIKGINATRTGYFSISFTSERPFALAVIT